MTDPSQEKDLAASIEDASEPLIYNSMVLENYLRMVKTRYPEIDINEILKNIGIEPWEIADPAQWMTQQQYNALHYELNRHFSQQREISLAREAGRFSCTEKSEKLIRELVFSFLNTTRAYDMFGDIAQRYSRAADYSSRRISKNKHQITITFKEGVQPQPFQCQNYTGYLEAIYFLFEKKWPKIEHPKCHFKGDPCCIYNISWDYSTSQTLNRLRNYLIAVSVVGLLPLLVLGFFRIALGTLVVSSLACLAISLMAEFLERRTFLNRVKQQRISPKEKVEGYDRFYNFARLFNEISHHLSKHTNISEVIARLSQILRGLSYDRGMIFIVDQKHDFALFSQPFGLDPELAAGLRNGLDRIKNELHKMPAEFKKPQVIRDPYHLPSPFPDEFKSVLGELGEAIFIPMTYENSVLGFFLVENRYGAKPLMASDINLLTTLASQTVLSVVNIAAFEAILRNEQLKNEFVAIASHELRTPIQVILLVLEEIQVALPDKARQELDMELKALDESTHRLEHIVKEILDINKLETSKSNIRIQNVSLRDLINTLRMESDALICAKGHKIQYNTNSLEQIPCDPDLMAQTLTNIVSNAAKYTPAGGRIEIHFVRTDTDITIDCLDNGIGIPKPYQEKIFMKFFQVEEASEQDKTGCGLGLSLCHEIIKKHGGYIDLESPLNPVDYPELGLGGARKGSKFSIHLVP